MLGLVEFDLLVLGIPVNLDFDTPGTLCDISSRQNSKVSFYLCHLCTARCLGYALGYECPIELLGCLIVYVYRRIFLLN